MYTLEELQSANLPVARVWTDDLGNLQTDFERALTPAEVKRFDDIQNGIVDNAVSISPSQQIILADGEDVAIVTISGEPGATVDYTINGQVQSLTLDDSGMDMLELTCDTPNTTLLVQVGSARAVIFAVEVPS